MSQGAGAMDELRAEFVSETRETLERIAGALIAWELRPEDPVQLAEIFPVRSYGQRELRLSRPAADRSTRPCRRDGVGDGAQRRSQRRRRDGRDDARDYRPARRARECSRGRRYGAPVDRPRRSAHRCSQNGSRNRGDGRPGAGGAQPDRADRCAVTRSHDEPGVRARARAQ